MTTSANGEVLSLANLLADTGIATDLTSLAGSGTLTFAAAQQILADVAARGPLSQAELSSLQAIAAHLNAGLAADSYTASVFTQFVDGSPLNAVWTGGVAESPVWTGGQENATPLGNLAVGSTTAQMNELIGKWFEGTDHPSAPWAYLGDTSLRYASYFTQTAPLYGPTGAPAAADVNQGSIGDCVLCSALIDYVVQHPTQAASMIRAEAAGVYGVRFYVNGNESWVTVDSTLPETSDGHLIFDGNAAAGQSVLWAALVEKAFAQFASNGLENLPAINNFGNITNVPIQVLLAISGASTITTLTPTTANPDAFKQAVIAALAAHDDVEVFSPLGAPDLKDAAGKITLATDHAQAVIGYDSKTGLFIVQNPWGYQNSSAYYPTWEMSLSQVASVGGSIQIDNSGQVGPSATQSNVIMTTANQQVVTGQTLSVTSLFHASSISGGAITKYGLTPTSGTINLNGATNLATAAQAATGEVVVSASDLGKLTLSGVSASGDLSVSAFDGSTWSPAAQVALELSGTSAGIVPTPATLAPGQTVALSSLFSVTGVLSSSNNTWYDVILSSNDGGTINLNGAQNVWGGGSPPAGSYQLTAASLGQVTYTAPSTGGAVTLQFQLYTGSAWSGWENELVTVSQPMTAAAAAQTIENGQLGSSLAVSDSASNIAANLDALNVGRAAGAVTGITLTDTGTPTLSLTAAQFSADTAALSAITGSYNLSITSVEGHATTITLPGSASAWTATPAGNGQGLTLTKAGYPTYYLTNVTALQFSDYTDIIASQTPAVAGAVSSFQVASLYSAVFARTPDAAGLAYYEGVAAANPTTPISTFAQWFMASPEYTGNAAHAYVQSAAGDTQFITDTYNNLLHRAPGSGDVDFYLSKVINPILGSITPGTSAYAAAELQARAQVLAYFSESPEFRADVQITAQHPADAQHWLVLI